MTKFRYASRANLPMILVGQLLHSITNSQNRDAAFQHPSVTVFRSFCVDAIRTSAKYDPLDMFTADSIEGRIIGDNLSKYPRFSYTPSDKLGVLSSKIQDYDCFIFHGNSSDCRLIRYLSYWYRVAYMGCLYSAQANKICCPGFSMNPSQIPVRILQYSLVSRLDRWASPPAREPEREGSW